MRKQSTPHYAKRLKLTVYHSWKAPLSPCITEYLTSIPTLRHVSIRWPKGYGIIDSEHRFKNLTSFEVYDVRPPWRHLSKEIAIVLVNSPALRTFGVSAASGGSQPLELFSAICQSYSTESSEVSSTGQQDLSSADHTPGTSPNRPLSLTKLHLGNKALLQHDVHLLTDTSVLEELYISNTTNKDYGFDVYARREAPLSFFATRSPNLRSLTLDILRALIDAGDIKLARDFPSLCELTILHSDIWTWIEIMNVGGAGPEIDMWKRLALGAPDVYEEGAFRQDFSVVLASSTRLTHLAIFTCKSDWVCQSNASYSAVLMGCLLMMMIYLAKVYGQHQPAPGITRAIRSTRRREWKLGCARRNEPAL